jgi:cephalosporin-C deacetylase-like acetyl esterase
MHFVSATLSPVWKLFVAKEIPEDASASITSVPDIFTLPSGEALKPVEVTLEGERADFNKILGGFVPEGTCGLFVGILNAEDDGVALYGAGADWWWTCYVNGEKAFARPRKDSGGNVRGSFLKTDWIFPIHVRKGANIIVFHLVSGQRWSIGTGVLPIGNGQDTHAEFRVSSFEVADLQLVGTTTRDPLSYRVGEEMEFVFFLKDPRAATTGKPLFLVWNRRGDDGTVDSGFTTISVEKPVRVRTSLARAGFVHVTASVATFPTPDTIPPLLQFEGGAGADIDALKPAATCPDDFDAFWTRQRALLDAVPLASETHLWQYPCFPDGTKIPKSLRMFLVKVACAGPNPVTGLLAVPKTPGKYPARVVFDGYSKEPKQSHRLMTEGVITFHVNAHGYDLFRDPVYYEAFFAPFERDIPAYGFSPRENSDPETSYYRGMALRAMRAFDYLKTLPEWNGRDLIATGGSQGGLQAVWAASLVPGVTRCETSIVWCSNIAGATLDNRLPGWHPQYVRGLDYYDTVFHAARIPASCFVDLERIGLGDYTCPPSGVTMVYNAVQGPKRAAYYQNSTHGYVPPEPSVFRIFDAEITDHDADLAPFFGCIDDETWEKAKSVQENFKQP